MGNLIVVNQGVQRRVFSYDALGHLVSARLPEYNNTDMLYIYHEVGNLVQKVAASCSYSEDMTYDVVGRMKSRSTNMGGYIVHYYFDYDSTSEPVPEGFSPGSYTHGRLARDCVEYQDGTAIERFY